MNFLILASEPMDKQLIRSFEDRGHTYEVYDPKDLYLTKLEEKLGLISLYHASPDLPEPVRVDESRFDAVVPLLLDSASEARAILRHLTKDMDLYCPLTNYDDLIEFTEQKTKDRQAKTNPYKEHWAIREQLEDPNGTKGRILTMAYKRHQNRVRFKEDYDRRTRTIQRRGSGEWANCFTL